MKSNRQWEVHQKPMTGLPCEEVEISKTVQGRGWNFILLIQSHGAKLKNTKSLRLKGGSPSPPSLSQGNH